MALSSPWTGLLYVVYQDGAFEKGVFQPIASLYLIAGFIVLIIKKTEDVFAKMTEELGMTISAASGLTIRMPDEDIKDAKKRVDEAMYICKQRYYQQVGNDRRNRA